MIINPIYFNLGSNSSGNGENDWDPTDVKENKEMLDLTNYTPLFMSIRAIYPTLQQLDYSDFKVNNTTLILQFVFTGTSDGYKDFDMFASIDGDSSSANNIQGSDISFSIITGISYCYKIKLPKIYNNHYIKFNGTSGKVNMNAWYKND